VSQPPVPQPGIFAQGTRSHHHLELSVRPDATDAAVVDALRQLREPTVTAGGVNLVLGLGPALWARLARDGVPGGFHDYPTIEGLDGKTAPGTQRDLWVWAHGTGGSFVIAQRWIHDLEAFHALPVEEQERVFGRSKADSIEMDDDTKPANAHIARVEIEIDGEEAEIYRRSTPYGTLAEHGLYFLGFSAELRRFEIMLNNMFGLGDGPRDRLTDFTRPVSGSFFFAPSVAALNALLD
jgi:deferrochelatase/peroxidase EfeB